MAIAVANKILTFMLYEPKYKSTIGDWAKDTNDKKTVTTQVHRGKGSGCAQEYAESRLAYLLLYFFLCAFAPLCLCVYLSSNKKLKIKKGGQTTLNIVN